MDQRTSCCAALAMLQQAALQQAVLACMHASQPGSSAPPLRSPPPAAHEPRCEWRNPEDKEMLPPLLLLVPELPAQGDGRVEGGACSEGKGLRS